MAARADGWDMKMEGLGESPGGAWRETPCLPVLAGCESGLENCERVDRKSRLLEAVAAGKEEGKATIK